MRDIELVGTSEGGRGVGEGFARGSSLGLCRVAVCLAAMLLMMTGCAGDIAGLSRGQRLQLYGMVLDAAGHPELGGPVGLIGRGLERAAGRGDGLGKQPREGVRPAPDEEVGL